MDPVESRVWLGVEAGAFEHRDDAAGHGEVGGECVGHVFGGVDVGDGGFFGVWVCGDFDLVVQRCPVCALLQESVRAAEEKGRWRDKSPL